MAVPQLPPRPYGFSGLSADFLGTRNAGQKSNGKAGSRAAVFRIAHFAEILQK